MDNKKWLKRRRRRDSEFIEPRDDVVEDIDEEEEVPAVEEETTYQVVKIKSCEVEKVALLAVGLHSQYNSVQLKAT